jgi:organic hydroperoxide reductase OsmC/OhrA
MDGVYVYWTQVAWKGGHRGELRLGNGPVLPFSAPPEAQGEAGVVTPEDAFVAAVNSCVMLMFLWSCERLKIELLSYECRAEGTKHIALDRTETFTQVALRPQIRVRGANRHQVERALTSAQKYSLVASSVKSEVRIEPTILCE